MTLLPQPSTLGLYVLLVTYHRFRRGHFLVKFERLALSITLYIGCVSGVFGREITEYTVMYGVYVRFWITLQKAQVGL